MLTVMEHHILEAEFHQARSMGGMLREPTLIVIHYSAGANIIGDRVTLTTGPHSAHFLIGRYGELEQLVPLNRVAYHAGESSWKGRANCNAFSIGIELTNWGALTFDYDKFISWCGTPVPSPEVLEGRHANPLWQSRFWHRYTCRQILSCQRVCDSLQAWSEIPMDITGHDVIAPKRKQDPGPAFPMEVLQRHG